jgi:hypothetical protein
MRNKSPKKKIPFRHTLIRGSIGKRFVVKHYAYGIVITKHPCMDKITPSPKQKHRRNIFKNAVAFARSINNDPVKKRQWKKLDNKSTVYHDVIRQYMQAHKEHKK